MKNLEKYNVIELSHSEQKEANGGFWWIATGLLMYSILSVAEFPDKFAEGVNSTFESSL